MTAHSRQTKARRYAPERGAILIQVAVASIVLIAFTMFVVDYGILWVSRRQAQNAADAGAMAGAIALAFDNFTDRSDTGPAKTAAYTLATFNEVWEETPDVNITTDVTFPLCPDDGTFRCIRVDVYRNQVRSNPLPMWFGQLVGLTDQGVKATATAMAAAGNASDCLKPFGIPDKWDEYQPVTKVWEPTDEFNKHDKKGIPLNPQDVYVPRTENPDGTTDEGTGYTLTADYGVMVTLKSGNPQDSLSPGFFFPVRLPMANGEVSTGGNDYRWNIANCNGVAIEEGQTLQNEPGNMIGPTFQGLQELYDLDPGARWNASLNDGEGGVENSCATAATPCAPRSPRIVAVPVFDTNVYYDGKMNGLVTLKIARIIGSFVNEIQGNTVTGYLCSVPGLVVGSEYPASLPGSSFLTSIQLVR